MFVGPIFIRALVLHEWRLDLIHRGRNSLPDCETESPCIKRKQESRNLAWDQVDFKYRFVSLGNHPLITRLPELPGVPVDRIFMYGVNNTMGVDKLFAKYFSLTAGPGIVTLSTDLARRISAKRLSVCERNIILLSEKLDWA